MSKEEKATIISAIEVAVIALQERKARIEGLYAGDNPLADKGAIKRLDARIKELIELEGKMYNTTQEQL